MNWIDVVILVVLGCAAVRGFMRGSVVEACAVGGVILGVWSGIVLNERVAAWMGWPPEREALAFLLVLLVVVSLVHLVGRLVTKAIEKAELSFPNKLGGVVLGVLRFAFALSVLLNVLFAKHESDWAPSLGAQKESAFFAPLRAFAPSIVPALGNTKWVRSALDRLKQEANEQMDSEARH